MRDRSCCPRHAVRAAAMAILLVAGGAAPGASDENWPRFRGPDGTGHHSGAPIPTTWGPSDVLWRRELTGEGHSSPIIWGDVIFLTSAADQGRRRLVIAVSASDGRVLWERSVPCDDPGRVHNMNSFATPSCATDGDRVIAFFDRAGMHCVSVDGKLLWSRSLGEFPGPWGVAASPIIVGDRVIQNCDAQGESWLVALDKTTGEIAWRASRGEKPMGGWNTPIVIRAPARMELIVNGETGVDAYDPATGRHLWFCSGFNGRGEPVPEFTHGLLFVLNGKAGDVYAIRPGGAGDVSETHRVWRAPRPRVRDIASPIAVGNRLFAIDMKGIAAMYDTASGRAVWQERIPGAFTASPIESGGLIYATDEAGETLVIRPGPALDIVARNKIGAPAGEIFRASPGPSGGRIHLRSNRALYCIGKR